LLGFGNADGFTKARIQARGDRRASCCQAGYGQQQA
jgi:hypothetical protein